MATVRVLIQSRRGVRDPEGEALERGLVRLGHSEVEAVDVGQVVDIDLATDDPEEIEERVEAMCAQLLVNSVVERYSWEIL